jgi:hypothetical protein
MCVYVHAYWWFQHIIYLMFPKFSKHYANISHIIFKLLNSLPAFTIDILMWLAFFKIFFFCVTMKITEKCASYA